MGLLNVLISTEFTARVAEIVPTEGVTPDLDILDTYVKATYRFA